MNALSHYLPRPARAADTRMPAPDLDAIRAYYVQTQEDYHRWSRGYNMHFGYWARGMSPFDREGMLERMNAEAIDALRLTSRETTKVVDLGCGAGATARALASRYPRAEVTGVTIVHEQIVLGCRLNRAAGLARRIGFVLSDFSETWIGRASQDGALAVESFCYAPGPDKIAALTEAARLLKPGARLVVADCFLVERAPRGLLGWIYRRWCDCWEIPGLAEVGAFRRALQTAGFGNVEVRDCFLHIAPCAAHVPWVATAHTVRELWRARGRLSRWRWRHIAASWLSLALGIARWRFRYCLVSATRLAAPSV